MAVTVNIQDQLPHGNVTNQLEFQVQDEQLTARELIRLRVFEEVQLYNLSTPGFFKGLVQPSEAEVTLNGYKLRQRRQIDWEKQADLALEAFESNGFFILVDDQQIEELDQFITITPETQINFVKLVPLVGG